MSVLFYRTKYENLSLNRFLCFRDLLCVLYRFLIFIYNSELWLRPSLVQGVAKSVDAIFAYKQRPHFKILVNSRRNVQDMETILLSTISFSQDMTVIGWYHSHPTSSPRPSQHDIVCQSVHQQHMRSLDGRIDPCLGVIVSPFRGTSPASEVCKYLFVEEVTYGNLF